MYSNGKYRPTKTNSSLIQHTSKEISLQSERWEECWGSWKECVRRLVSLWCDWSSWKKCMWYVVWECRSFSKSSSSAVEHRSSKVGKSYGTADVQNPDLFAWRRTASVTHSQPHHLQLNCFPAETCQGCQPIRYISKRIERRWIYEVRLQLFTRHMINDKRASQRTKLGWHEIIKLTVVWLRTCWAVEVPERWSSVEVIRPNCLETTSSRRTAEGSTRTATHLLDVCRSLFCVGSALYVSSSSTLLSVPLCQSATVDNLTTSRRHTTHFHGTRQIVQVLTPSQYKFISKLLLLLNDVAKSSIWQLLYRLNLFLCFHIFCLECAFVTLIKIT